MRKKSLFIIFIAMAFSTMAQNVTAILPFISDNTIVREYAHNVFIVFNYNTVESTVNYVDMASGVVLSADVTPAEVSDFEIYDGSVYFCGTAAGTPIAGFFNVYSVFFGSGQIDYFPLSYPIGCNDFPPDIDIITSAMKIEVMPKGSDKPHMIIIGEATCTRIPNQVNRCVIDLYYDGTDWIIAMSQAHDGILYYDDVAVTENYVVCVGHKHPSDAEYLVPFKRAIASDNIFDESNITPYGTWDLFMAGGGNDYDPATDEEFLIEHIDGDIVATVCHGYHRMSEGTILNIYDPAFSVADRCMIYDYSYRNCDLKYNPVTNGLYLLPGTASTCPESYIEYQLSGTMQSVAFASKYTDISASPISFTSLDAAPLTFQAGIGQAILTGEVGGKLYLWRHGSPGEIECYLQSDVDLDRLMTDNGNPRNVYYYGKTAVSRNSITPNILIIETTPVCTNNAKNNEK